MSATTYGFLNECMFRATAGGLSNFVVSAAITGYYTPAQCTNPGATNGAIYAWRAESDDLTEHELFIGSYTTGTATVARTTILQSSNAGAKVNFTAAPKVRQVLLTQQAGIVAPTSTSVATTNITLASSVAGNVFPNHMAIGNYAEINAIIFGPGDPGGFSLPYVKPIALAINEYNVGDFSGQRVVGIANWPGVKHTGAGSADTYAIDGQTLANSDNTGTFGAVGGLQFGGVNYGSGAITEVLGITCFGEHDGLSTVTYLVGLEAYIQMYQPGTTTYGRTIVAIAPIKSGGAHYTNVTGVHIDDHSGIGSTSSYNIYSGGTSHITPASTTGGNLFVNHMAVGNYADVDIPFFAPSDPVNQGAYPGPTVLNLSDLTTGDFNVLAPSGNIQGIAVWPGYRHTGAGLFQDLAALQLSPAVNSNSTGDLNIFAGAQFNAYNYGGGDISRLFAFIAVPDHSGSGSVASLTAAYLRPTANGIVQDAIGIELDLRLSGTVTNAYGVSIDTPTGASTNSYGLYVGDHSGIGGTISENIRSKGAASRNTFEGTINFGTATNTPADGDVWFDGTNLNLRTGGVTKTVVVV